MAYGTFLEVEWLRLCATTAGGTDSIPGQGTKIWHTGRHSQKITISKNEKEVTYYLLYCMSLATQTNPGTIEVLKIEWLAGAFISFTGPEGHMCHYACSYLTTAFHLKIFSLFCWKNVNICFKLKILLIYVREALSAPVQCCFLLEFVKVFWS